MSTVRNQVIERFAVTDHPNGPGSVVITVHGEVDLLSGPLLHARLQEHIHEAGPDLVVDLTAVRHFGSSGLTTLMAAWNATVIAGVAFRVVARTRTVLHPLRITGVDRIVDVVPDLTTTS
ncbi:STAS domain-containing protein [Lentzea tibetensis]|uniref:STAS domain-containing protein n=1 Tax=Lentzea tibetensis TaxID=2591470 RepID=UPI001646F6C6|nr:STAS domain-containing protein [Lentzea tibetensis]